MEKILAIATFMAAIYFLFQVQFRKREQLQQARINEKLSDKARRRAHRPDLAKINLIDADLDIDLD